MKTAQLPMPVTWDPHNIAGGWADCFRFPISAHAGLPPSSQARILRVLLTRIDALRVWYYLWVELDAPGRWYAHELQRLVGNPNRLVITPPKNLLRLTDLPDPPMLFVEHPDDRSSLLPDCRGPTPITLKPSVLRVLQTLARLENGQTREIASLSGFSKSYTHTILAKLVNMDYARRAQVWKYPGWVLTPSGLRLAHRSWQLPPQTNFRSYRQEHQRAGYRHRRVARLWRAWLRKAYAGVVEIWDCWTEFAMHPGYPDALAWGTWKGMETLFWLEVDTGNNSTDGLRTIYKKRFDWVADHVWRSNTPTIFTLLSLPWVLKAVDPIFHSIPSTVAVILEDWRKFGVLPTPEFGLCNIGIPPAHQPETINRPVLQQLWKEGYGAMRSKRK